MMRKFVAWLSVFVVIIVASSPVSATESFYVHLEDGRTHTIYNDSYSSKFLTIDRYVVNFPGTHVDLVYGGILKDVFAYNNATFTMSSGRVNGGLFLYDNSSFLLKNSVLDNDVWAYDDVIIDISGGRIGEFCNLNDNAMVNFNWGDVGGFECRGQAQVNMSGGTVHRLRIGGDSSFTMSGGKITEDTYRNLYGQLISNTYDGSISTSSNGTIFLEGTDFTVTDLDGNSTSLFVGDKLSNFGTLVDSGSSNCDFIAGTITGTLKDGTLISNEFEIYNSGFLEGNGDIHIIPEPCSLALLGLGGLILRRRKA